MSDFEDTSHYEGALLEEIRDMFKALHEGQEAMVEVPTQIKDIQEHIVVIESDIEIIKSVMRIHSVQIDNHEGRITKLEGSAA